MEVYNCKTSKESFAEERLEEFPLAEAKLDSCRVALSTAFKRTVIEEVGSCSSAAAWRMALLTFSTAPTARSVSS
jgi:hypothetical protein